MPPSLSNATNTPTHDSIESNVYGVITMLTVDGTIAFFVIYAGSIVAAAAIWFTLRAVKLL